ncbi:MAG: YARHG domain-containing protein [Lachnospiraceae bacterium]|nr:YARHG domain-containing protein [Lachnospiraceae bacterium]MCM1240230.1 YARHG domain-containing protein [Lachnospiraceae bacterium]
MRGKGMDQNIKGKLKTVLCLLATVSALAGCSSREPAEDLQAVQLSGENIASEDHQAAGAPAGMQENADAASSDGVSMDIPEGQIAEQSFPVDLEEWGEVTFASFWPEQDMFQKDGIWMYGDARFMLLKDGEAAYISPEQFEDNGMRGQQFGQVVSVAFCDYNEDGRTDVLLILEYAGVQGIDIGTSWMEVRAYARKEGEKAFALDSAAAEYVNRNISWGDSMTMEDVMRSLEGYAGHWQQDQALDQRMEYYRESAYYQEIVDYWENVREVRDISNRTDFLFATDTRYYTAADFQDEPSLVIHLAKNEIYARHGYIFDDPDLYNYFMGCIWYTPTTAPKDFDASVLNEYEKKNVKVLAGLDDF